MPVTDEGKAGAFRIPGVDVEAALASVKTPVTEELLLAFLLLVDGIPVVSLINYIYFDRY